VSLTAQPRPNAITISHQLFVSTQVRKQVRPGSCYFAGQVGIGDLIEAFGGSTIDQVVFGKIADLADEPLAPGERTLLDQLPDQGSEAESWAQNERVLLQEMKSGNPIRDALVDPVTGALENNTGFLTMEREVLEREGWNYGPSTHVWSPGG
jgi:hypothetical protein